MAAGDPSQAVADVQDQLAQAELPVSRDPFFRSILRDLAGTLEEVVGPQDAKGFVAVVGAKIGDEFNDLYRTALARRELTAPQVAAACCDLKRRIGGDFYVVSQSDSEILFGNRRCPFGEKVLGRPSLCMMTSNVFGRIAAENLGYADVAVERAIADGDAGCTVRVTLDPDADRAGLGREYYRTQDGER